MVTCRDPTAGGDGCVPAVSSASVAEGDDDRTAVAASLRDVEGARGGRDVGPGDGGAVREGLERSADGGAGGGLAAPLAGRQQRESWVLTVREKRNRRERWRVKMEEGKMTDRGCGAAEPGGPTR
jgi:hypothetical protein